MKEEATIRTREDRRFMILLVVASIFIFGSGALENKKRNRTQLAGTGLEGTACKP
jgi:hypothetical protein